MTDRAWYAVAFAAAIGYAVALSGCAFCRVPANASLMQCKAERVIISCGPKAMSIIAEVLPMVIAQDMESALAIIASQTGDEAQCIRNAIDSLMVARYGAGSEVVAKFRSVRLKYESQHK